MTSETVPSDAPVLVPAPTDAAQPAVDLRQVVEALLFAAPKPLSARQIANLLAKSTETHGADFHLFQSATEEQVAEAIAALVEEYAAAPRGLVVQQIAGGHRFGTRPRTATWVRQLFDETRPSRLSQPALETLAIVAYRQPISRADIEAVRGVAVDGVVTTLLERRLIKLAGRSDAPGRPLLYETTPEFLECFGLGSLEELPNADELRRIQLRTAPRPPGEVPAQPDLTPQEAAPAGGSAESASEDAETAAEETAPVGEDFSSEGDASPETDSDPESADPR